MVRVFLKRFSSFLTMDQDFGDAAEELQHPDMAEQPVLELWSFVVYGDSRKVAYPAD